MPHTPVDGFDLKALATVTAHLAARKEPRAAVLARAGLDELRWLAIEKTWMLRIATALLQRDPSLGQAYDAAFAAAKAKLEAGPDRPPPERG
ncbi:hypothetical protein BE04_24745 [Sorangium cellulosum]|uniref:Uncharacterized protein n=1 Tax=Sorangium cellulosum TaxID=56 RepID=A0A150P2T9_SORCE|nr:hypothetical protein BE04_24745 [Sorangium cellulosum]